MSLPIPENSPEVDKAELVNRRLLRGIVIGIVIIVLGGVVSLYLTGKQTAKQSTIEHAVRVILLSNQRSDCRTAYNSDRNTVLEHAQIVERKNVGSFGGYLLSQGVSTADLQANQKAMNEANDAVDKLPTLNDMVDHGYAMGGVKHPPCPVVK